MKHQLFNPAPKVQSQAITWLGILVALFILAACSKKNHYPSKPITGIVIDGQAAEWPRLTQYDKDSKILYDVFHDHEKLYVLLQTSDEATARKIGLLGLTLWVDENGKERKIKGINYPLNRSAQLRQQMQQRMQQGGGGFDGQVPGGQKPGQQLKPGNEARLLGFGGIKEQNISLTDASTQIEVAVGRGGSPDALMVYEAAIPLYLVAGQLASGKTKLADLTLSIGLETGSLNMQMPGGGFGGMARMGGRMGGGMRPMGGGMAGRSGRRMGGVQQLQSMRTPTKLWVTTTLQAQ